MTTTRNVQSRSNACGLTGLKSIGLLNDKNSSSSNAKHAGVYGLKQQAASLLPKTLSAEKLTQVAHLVRNKTQNTLQNKLQNRFNFKTSSNAASLRTMQNNDTIEAAAQDTNMMDVVDVPPPTTNDQTMVLAAASSKPAVETSLVRSQTFDCDDATSGAALPVHLPPSAVLPMDIGDTSTVNKSQQLQYNSTFDVHTSSPILNATQTRCRFSLGDSQLIDTSSVILSASQLDGTEGVENGRRSSLYLDIGNGTQSPASTSGSIVNGLLRAKLKQSVQHRLDSTLSTHFVSTPAAHSLTLPSFSSQESPVLSIGNSTRILSPGPPAESPVAAAASSTMMLPSSASENVWNVSEITGSNGTYVLSKTGNGAESNNVTLMAAGSMDHIMDYDDGTMSRYLFSYVYCSIINISSTLQPIHRTTTASRHTIFPLARHHPR